MLSFAPSTGSKLTGSARVSRTEIQTYPYRTQGEDDAFNNYEDQEIMIAAQDDLRAVRIVSEVSGVDIHPGAKIGRGTFLDHATGVVIGETVVIGNDVSILRNMTSGGTGKVFEDGHPKISDEVLIEVGICVLGNVRIEYGAQIGAGSVVLKQVPVRTIAVENPAKLIGGNDNPV
ncbi:unnamed protein product [Fraxinus pennsylvanica]|uniref:serine O-acetyltransferase n=1 Tax=Fraxinus pennsylvanica TaxID=56036 RepID=A0AAD2A134_9LAMI|nr:unnamed protein product [Fraxinus pennsylvanica]